MIASAAASTLFAGRESGAPATPMGENRSVPSRPNGLARPAASLALPVLAGAVLAFAYWASTLPVPFPYTVFVGFVPLLLWIDGHRDRPWREVRRAGFAFGMTLHLLILSWMYSMLWMSFLAVFAYLGLALLFAAGTTAAVVLLAWLRRRIGWPFAVLLPACWLSLEWAQALGDFRQTAQHLAHTLAATPFLVQFADVTGPYGVGAFALVVNALLYGMLTPRGPSRRRVGAALGALAIVVLAYDTWAWTHPPVPTRTLRVALVQPNIPLAVKHDGSSEGIQWSTLARLTFQAGIGGPDLVIWPETARPRPVIHVPSRPETYAVPDVGSLASRTGAAVLTGVEYVVDQGDGRYDLYNAAMVVHPDGSLDPTWCAKIYLVPFVEGVPFRPLLGPVLDDLKGPLRWLAGGFTSGPPSTPLRLGDARVGVTVCFEELFFDLHRGLRNAGADFQVVVTNHAWFRRSFFQRYAANALRLRAIENRSAFVRAANTGISGFVDPLGRYHETTRLFEEAVRTWDVPLTSERTVYDRAGDVAAWAALLMLAAATVAAAARREARHAPADDPSAQPPDVGAVS